MKSSYVKDCEWLKWCQANELPTKNWQANLKNSTVGKAFSYAWDMAEVAMFEHIVSYRPRQPILPDPDEDLFKQEKVDPPSKEPKKTTEDVYAINLGTLPFTTKTYNALKADDFQTVGDLVKYSASQLRRVPNIGRKSIEQIKEILGSMNLKLQDQQWLDKQPTKRMEQLNAYTNQCRKRRLGIYNEWKHDGKTIRELAGLHGVSNGRIHQIIKQTERDLKRLHDGLPSLEAIKYHSTLKPIPPWLQKEQSNESGDDQRSGTPAD